MQPLFDAELTYVESMRPVVAVESREGRFIGSGTGSVTGRDIAGVIRWSMFAADCRFSLDASADPNAGLLASGDHLCKTDPVMVIDTHDGATIWVEGRGFGLRKQHQHPEWTLTTALRFETQHPKYLWLNRIVGAWEGNFDEGKQRAIYRAFVAP